MVFGGRLVDVDEVRQVDPGCGEYTMHRGDRQSVDEGGSHAIKINTGSLTPGLYFLTVHADSLLLRTVAVKVP